MRPAHVTIELLKEPDTKRANLLLDDSASLLMDDTDFRTTYNVPTSAPANQAPQPMLAAFGMVAPGGSSHNLLAPTHLLIVPIMMITTQHPHPALATSGPLTTADGMRSPPTTTHTPSSVALGKRCLVEILCDDEADPVALTSIKVCVLSNIQIPDTLEENLITTSTLNLWYELSAVCSEVLLQAPNCDDHVAVSCNDIRKFCQLFQYLDLPRSLNATESQAHLTRRRRRNWEFRYTSALIHALDIPVFLCSSEFGFVYIPTSIASVGKEDLLITLNSPFLLRGILEKSSLFPCPGHSSPQLCLISSCHIVGFFGASPIR
ncbi:hypothetical protein C8J57DRAFT_1211381 [Mycena rebaudengoi]|nr:hypothetical protein C8J57DRAFT_1211381 [Mycena rebaudengoi]